MSNTADTAQVLIRPPIAWIAGLTFNWLMPLPFLTAAVPARWVGGVVFVLALVLLAWAISTITRAGSNVPTNRPATTIVESGPYRFTRNPMYLCGMLIWLGWIILYGSVAVLAGAGIFWGSVAALVVPWEERNLEARFGEAYVRYKNSVPRWVGKRSR